MVTSDSREANRGNGSYLRPTPLRFAVIAVLTLSGLLAIRFGEWKSAAQTQPEGAVITGRVQDERGAPVAQAVVSIAATDFAATVPTQADGKFEFRLLKPGQYRVVAEAARYRKERTSVTITRPDEVIPPLVIRLLPTSLHVAVLDTGNQALGGVTLTLSSRDRSRSGAVERSVTDEGGDAYFGRLAPGSYLLAASLRGYDDYRNEVFISPGITTELPIQLAVAPLIPVNEKALTRLSIPSIPSKTVQALYQDREGWVWIGTDRGLARFNGSDTRSSASPGSPYESFAGESVRSIVQDQSDVIWLATGNGVRRISPDGSDRGNLFEGVDVRLLFADSTGAIWVSGTDSLYRYLEDEVFRFDTSSGLPDTQIRSIEEEKQGKIWVATAAGLAVFEGDRFNRFSAPISTPSRQQSTNEEEIQDPLNDCRSVFRDASGNMWFGTSRGVFHLNSGKFDPRPLFSGREVIKAAATDPSVVAIGQDPADRGGRMWFALESSGVVLSEMSPEQSQRMNSLERDRVTTILTCREGNVVFGTENGMVNADFYSFVNYTSSRGLADNDVAAVSESPGGSLWFLTSVGLSRMSEGRIAAVERFPSNLSPRSIVFDGSAAWVATRLGVLKLSGQTLTQLNEGNGLASNNVHWVEALSDGSKMIFGTSAGASIYQDEKLKSIEPVAGYDVRHIFEDKDGKLWLSTSRGLMLIDLQNNGSQLLDTSAGLADNDVRWCLRFNDKLVVATRGGTQFYDHELRPVPFSPFDADSATALFVDSDNYLWLGTEDGQVKKFAQVGGQRVSFVYTGESMPFTGGRINSITEAGGSIWIATDRGAVRHIPTRVSPVARTLLRVNETPQQESSEGYYVPNGSNRLTFSFAASSMTGQVTFLYRILGSGSQQWELVPVQKAADHEVSRFELPEGGHTFELMAVNRDLYGVRAPAVAFSVTIGSPLWKRWWFYATAMALMLVVATVIIAARRLRDREYILPKELRVYIPIEPNPYIVGNPIRSEKMFYGREDDFRYIRTKLESANQGVVIVFCGDRRVGKSSILYQVLNGRLGERFIPVFVDMQEMVITSDAEFFSRVSRLMLDAIAKADHKSLTRAKPVLSEGVMTTGGGAVIAASGTPRIEPSSPRLQLEAPRFDGRNPYPVFIDFFDEVLKSTRDRTLLILIDEYELMEAKVDEGKLSPDLFTFLAGMMDNKERLAFIFTGSRRLEERDKKYWRELLRRSLFRKVGFLTERDTFRLITEPVEGRVIYGRGVGEAIYRLTAGQAFYTQVICQNMVDYMNEHRQNWITTSGLEQVIADIIDNPLPQMIYTWDALSDDEKLVLSLLAQILPDGAAYATAYELRTSVRANEYPVNLSENTIRLTLEEMFRRELLEKEFGEGFRFRIDLLRIWIRRSHSIWQAVKEVRTL